jgi:hypothetical protein
MTSETFGRRALSLALFLLAIGLEHPGLGSDAFSRLDAHYQSEVRVLVRTHCLGCHSTELQEGALDLERFASVDDVRRSPRTWEKVSEFLSSGEMPPKEAPRPSDEDRARLMGWVASYLKAEGEASAGDPGPVVLRRLSNAEYAYTMRDLTGFDYHLTREFPADGAAGEGFTNTGQALVMSSSLMTKYLDAAKVAASHLMLTPDGARFAPGASSREWTDELLAQIRGLYAKYSGDSAGTRVNLQGIEFGTNQGGRLPLETYLAAIIEDRKTLDGGPGSVAAVAARRGLSAKYLGIVWDATKADDDGMLMTSWRQRVRDAKPGDVGAIVADVERWQAALWAFRSVGHIGKVGGPKRWMERVSPLLETREVRLKIEAREPSPEPSLVTLTLEAGDAGDGATDDVAVWSRPRFIAEGKPDLSLRDAIEQAAKAGITTPRGLDASGENVEIAAPGSVVITLPTALVAGREFVASVTTRGEGSIQARALVGTSRTIEGLRPDLPVLVVTGSGAARRLEAGFEAFRALFPPALCYAKIVPVDEVVTLTLFHREDDELRRLMLDETEARELDRLWAELSFVSEEALKLRDAFEQLLEYASQDADPSVFTPMKKSIDEKVAAHQSMTLKAEPRHVEWVAGFASRAYRRPLTEEERDGLTRLYPSLRKEGLGHDEAVRLMVARVLVAPGFLYRVERPSSDRMWSPVSDFELASRLSYFLWSSMPDDVLMSEARAGRLRDPDVLVAQARRMLKDDRTRRLATEFGCQWLHVADLDTLDEKSERHFPTFLALRGPMREEAVLFFQDLFQNDRSVLSLIDADHTYLNEDLAKHYGVPGVTGPEWRRVEGIRTLGRGGVLGLAATLAKQSGASRTSPILRGSWVSEALLGEPLPRPPKNVPVLPEDETSTEGLTVRQMVEKHTATPSCAKCHERIDPIGFALEGYDAIGRLRTTDLGDRPIDARSRLRDGTELDGMDGLRAYLMTRRDAFVHQFCRKLLGYALGRGTQLSDGVVLDEMTRALESNEHRVTAAIEAIVRSRPFREVRGREMEMGP